MPRLTTQSDVTNPQRKGYDFRIDDFLLRAATGPSQDRQMIIQSSDVGQENAVNVISGMFKGMIGQMMRTLDKFQSKITKLTIQ